jgi:catechol 2,3-dioxygenase-like lactoylglutathione lyase family enzyme
MESRGTMRLRLELFVTDLESSVAWYVEVLGFGLVRADPGYASLQRGDVVLGLGPTAKLPPDGAWPGHTQARVARRPVWVSRSSWSSTSRPRSRRPPPG